MIGKRVVNQGGRYSLLLKKIRFPGVFSGNRKLTYDWFERQCNEMCQLSIVTR